MTRYGEETGLSSSDCSGPCYAGHFCAPGTTPDTMQAFSFGALVSQPVTGNSPSGSEAGSGSGSGSDSGTESGGGAGNAAPAAFGSVRDPPYQTFSELGASVVTSGVAVTPPLVVKLDPPSATPIGCEVVPATVGVVVEYGSVQVETNATFDDMRITAAPGSTVSVQVCVCMVAGLASACLTSVCAHYCSCGVGVARRRWCR